MSPEVFAALIGLVGVIIGAIPTYLFMRQKNSAEVEKLKAETDKIKAEAEKIRAEFPANKVGSTEGKVRILYVAANPIDTVRLRLDDEIRGIKQSLVKSSQRNMFELDQLWSVRWEDLRSQLLRYTPDVLHISGHGSKQGIVLEDESGQHMNIVPAKAITALLSLFGEKIRLVIINTNYAEEICEPLAQSIDFVIGACGAVTDKQANKFSAAFYEALADGKDVRAAFEYAHTSSDEQDTDTQGSYQLFTFKKASEKYFLFGP